MAHQDDPLIVLYSFPHPIGGPGIGWTAWNQVTELVEAGHIVHLVTAAVARPIAGLASQTTTLSVRDRRIRPRLIGKRRAAWWHDVRAAARVKDVFPDVVHAWPGASAKTLLAATQVGIPAFREAPNTHTAHAYDVVAAEIESLGDSSLGRTAHTFDRRNLAREQQEWETATAILAPSDVVAETFLARGFPPEQILRHRYGIRPTGPPPTPRDADAGRDLTVCFVGRAEPRKGLHHALRAWSNSTTSRSGRFLIFGVPVEGYRELLVDLADLPGVEWRGFTSNPSAAYDEADVLLLPSVEEGSALVTYEAQARGCVPLVSRAAGALMTDGTHGLLHDAGDHVTLTAQLDLLDGDREMLTRLSAACIDHIDELTWERASETLVHAYRSVLERPRFRTSAKTSQLTVAICTRDRPAMLRRALKAVVEAGPADIDIVVVDSASLTPETEQVAREFDVTFVRTEVPGLSIARNVALRATTRPFILFTDDDCIPEPGWAEVAVRHFRAPRVGAVTGRMLDHSLTGQAATFPPVKHVSKTHQGIDAGHGAVMAFRRELLTRLGGFDEVLGAGRAMAGAEDLDALCRVISAGATIVNDQRCVVKHSHTREGDELERLARGYAAGLGGMLRKWWHIHPFEAARLSVIVVRRAVAQIIRADTRRARAVHAGVLLTGARHALARSFPSVVGEVFVEDSSRPVPLISPPH